MRPAFSFLSEFRRSGCVVGTDGTGDAGRARRRRLRCPL